MQIDDFGEQRPAYGGGLISAPKQSATQIKVIGIGGGGGNAINRMSDKKLDGVSYVAMNTDIQVLKSSKADEVVALGPRFSNGRGAGANPAIGKKCAEESEADIDSILQNANMVFLTAGMGGGTGTGAIPVVARLAREKGILTVAVVTTPFAFEGQRKMRIAEDGIDRLKEFVDAIIIVPNERLKMSRPEKLTLKNAFAIADDVLGDGVIGIATLISAASFINMDFADVRAVMKDAGHAHMGIGVGRGSGCVLTAAKAAVSSPLLGTSISGASGILLSIIIPPTIGLDEVEQAAQYVTDMADSEANVIWGISFDDEAKDQAKIILVATGFDALKNIEHLGAKPAPIKEVVNATTAAQSVSKPNFGLFDTPEEVPLPVTGAKMEDPENPDHNDPYWEIKEIFKKNKKPEGGKNNGGY